MHAQLIIYSPDELPAAAKTILQTCADRKIFAFLGGMGSGKTTIIKALCSELGVNEKAVSPTFAIVNEYSGAVRVFHIDLYRLTSLQEAIDIGIDEYLASGNYCFIEWAELISNLLPEETVMVNLSVGVNGERMVSIDFG